MITLSLIVHVDRAAPGDRRGRPREPGQFERVVETAVELSVVAAARLAMALLIMCLFAGWSAAQACRVAVAGFRRLVWSS